MLNEKYINHTLGKFLDTIKSSKEHLNQCQPYNFLSQEANTISIPLS